jgi:hypothetical protein
MGDWLNAYQEFVKTPWQPTKLKPEQEPAFRTWLTSTDLFKSIREDIAKENEIPADKMDKDRVLEMILESPDYDYRGAFLDNMKSEVNPYDNKPHFMSSDRSGRMLKAPTHETAWKEFFMRQFKFDPDSIGLDTLDKAQKWTNIMMQNPVDVNYSDPLGFSIR